MQHIQRISVLGTINMSTILLGMTKYSLSYMYSVFMDKILRRKKSISFKSVHLTSSDIYMTKIPSCYGSPGWTLFVITIGTSCLLFITYLLSLVTYYLSLNIIGY